jgi:hypothetical protein
MGTEGDRWPILNIPSFGACIATPNVPCFPSPVIWQQPREGVYINNNRMLLENSTAKCLRGGIVSIQFTYANLQNSPTGSFKRPSEYIKEGFDWVFGKLDENLAEVRAGAPAWLQSSIDQLAWQAKASVGIVEGAVNGVVSLGELIWDVATDPVGVGTVICTGVADGATKAWEWGSKGENWTKAGNDAWDWASDGENWKKAAASADQWLKDNPRVVGNVAGEVLLEAGAAVATGGGSLGGSVIKKGVKEVAEEFLEYGTKKLLKEGGQEATEEVIEEAAEKGTKSIIKDGAEETIEKELKNSTPEVITKNGKLEAGTPEHKSQRWKDYQERGGKWDYERWSKQYDTNMKNANHGLSRESAYRGMLGGESKTVKTPTTNRQIDIYKGDDFYAGQLKTGKVNLTKQAKIDIEKDAYLVKQGYKVEYVLEKGASQPFLDALKTNGIDYKIGSQIP